MSAASPARHGMRTDSRRCSQATAGQPRRALVRGQAGVQTFDRFQKNRDRYGLGDEGSPSQFIRQVYLVVTADHHVGNPPFLEAYGQLCARAVDELGIEN